MQNTLKALAALALLGASALATAADLADDMDTIAGNYKTVLSTDSADTLKQSLQNMRAAALDAKQGTPPKLEDKAADSPEMKDFRHGLDQLIGQIDRSLALANQGKVAEAKQVAQGFKQTRDANHKKFR
ncbi:cytochrome b562 [Serratia entomophila]|uniref:cytochrome b562 n=1 Tax=Serratia entomophila TaxID=42906 RepID=UPI00217C976E|nr:cytochrome b562 [Serratia entomophila]CAI1020618.1 Soluble cytochrome b562 precursor [Serratia entomophila]CAI1026317.1 Soluble cytochrome b562 precursor [Serratia entomophila]CAI1034639.1 Soluble cytochrome b562 precursor [Serratia entomophila]CAI1035592.1 Soluble cytochrome b562 precursor [Serratia entomophila]CAI1847898.1 Soluble cytochrome b562 precursor [Serratia entomophila]